MDGKNSIGRFWPFSRRHADEPRPEPKTAEKLTAPELTHLAYVMEQWCAGGSQEKRDIAEGIIKKAERGLLKAEISWDGDMPDMLGSRFVIERQSMVHRDTQAIDAIEGLYARWEKSGKKLPPAEELQLINRCLDLHDAAFSAASPLAMNMIKLGARACELTVQVHRWGDDSQLQVKISEKDRTCVLTAKNRSATVSGPGYLKLQLALTRLLRIAQMSGTANVQFDAIIPPPYRPSWGKMDLTDSEVRQLFDLKHFQYFGRPSGEEFRTQKAQEIGDVIADARDFFRPRMEALARESGERMKEALSAAIPREVLEVMAKTLAGAPDKPPAADLRRYALDMAGLLKPENTKGVKDHVLVQRAETTIKAWLVYFRACEDGIPLAFKWEDFTECLTLVGHARDKLGKDTPFFDKDAEVALQQLLKVERPPTAQPEAGSKAD